MSSVLTVEANESAHFAEFECEELPQIFCWTKMGTEAGQSLDVILRRKELERRAGGGTFAWGIGNSLGTAVSTAQQSKSNREIDVLFTPMKSAPKTIDSAPDQLLLWTSYIKNDHETADLPEYVLATSRGGNEKRAHYALLCHSDEKISSQRAVGVLDAACARNFKSRKPVGASQVTAVVHYKANKQHDPKSPYQIAFRAKLQDEGFVRLTSPLLLTGALLDLYQEACHATTINEWKARSAAVRALAEEKIAKNPSQQIRLF